ncbi:hypothetical protein D5S17_09400 [Pseudonocardiaceae bacterium YIM PH 21723]|nr:hypothetical protein D5S17_09400 [Pseudonocardiaceae bacterium YIM PH 21723]
MAVRLKPQKAVNLSVAHLDAVRDAVREHAAEIGIRAHSRLLAHRHHGDAEITITHGTGDVDSFVNLDDEAAFAIENGHFNPESGRWVDGIYVLTHAARLL